MRELADLVAGRTGLERASAARAPKTGFAAIAERLGPGEPIAAAPARRVRSRAGSAVLRAPKGEG